MLFTSPWTKKLWCLQAPVTQIHTHRLDHYNALSAFLSQEVKIALIVFSTIPDLITCLEMSSSKFSLKTGTSEYNQKNVMFTFVINNNHFLAPQVALIIFAMIDECVSELLFWKFQRNKHLALSKCMFLVWYLVIQWTLSELSGDRGN